MHVCNDHGQESLAPDDVARTLDAIRTACPGIPVGVSTGAWILPDVSQRLTLLRAWHVLPDFASVNLHETGAMQVIEILFAKGVGVEAGIWNARAAETLLRSGLAEACVRLLLEPAEEGDDVRDPATDRGDPRSGQPSTTAARGRALRMGQPWWSRALGSARGRMPSAYRKRVGSRPPPSVCERL